MSSMNIEQTRQPLPLASHVPGDIYSSSEVFAREKERIFLKDWLCIARVEEIANPGDYMTFRIMNEPILLVRDMEGVVRVFANLCLHRGVELAMGQGNVKEFSCPYHAWAYDLKGQLIGAPYMRQSAGFDAKDCKLKEVKVSLWAGWVFVNLDPASEPLETYMSEFARDVDFLKMENCVLGNKLVVDLECNWKLVVENLMDVYHAQTLHAKSFGKHRRNPELCPFELRKYGGTCTIYDAAPMTPDGKTLFRNMPAIADKPDNFAISAHLAPNMQVIARADNIHPLVMWPVTPTTSRTVIYNLFPKEFSEEPDFKERARVYHDYLSLVLSEDRDMVASLQQAMASSLFVPGRMSFLEKGIHHVLNAYIDRMFAQ
jgi:phenylpropionate dioxygenase-like ring-hydroxylating dioxygenase large terminal subunit